MARQKLFSVTKRDFEIQTFRAGGKGGQNVNKRDTAVRILHAASGAVAESREERTQERNKAIAFRRLTSSKKFQTWLKVMAAAMVEGFADIEAKVDADMAESNLKIETIRCGGRRG